MLTEYDAVETLQFNSSCMWDASTFGSEYLLMMILLVVMPLEHLVFYACCASSLHNPWVLSLELLTVMRPLYRLVQLLIPYLH